MQPYFLPYAGYFRLMAGVDVFVLFDDVQFPRRGWVHRNRLRRDDGRLGWLTLPLAYSPLQTRISELAFHADGQAQWEKRMDVFPLLRRPRGVVADVVERMRVLPDCPQTLLDETLRGIAGVLGLTTPVLRSRDLGLDAGWTGVDRIIALCRAVGATGYLNAPGGRALYTAETFRHHGIRLGFLPDYEGDASSILQRLHDEDGDSLRHEVFAGLAGIEWLD